MKLPEWRPIPPHLKNDHDTKDAGASLSLIGSILLIALSLGAVLIGLLA